MDIGFVKDYLGKDWLSVQDCMTDVLNSDINLLNSTNSSILSHSGKQLRPLLVLLIARACGDVTAASVRYASASELLHNATLLHDDVADCSDRRRGEPTIMSLMGPSVSVLVGDYWLVKAMQLILGSTEADMEATRIFSKTLSDLAEGEMLQLQKSQSGDTDEDDYLRIIYNKTASLFEAACVTGALSANADQAQKDAARDYAVSLGLAFQIKDDILDYVGDESMGKPLGADILEQKITMPLLGALGNVDEEVQTEIRSKVKRVVENPGLRDEIVTFVKDNGGIDYAEKRLLELVESAVSALDAFPECQEKAFLKELAYFTAKRDR